MFDPKKKRYQTRKGTDFDSNIAATERRIVRIAEDLFDSWGYQPTRLPLLDYYDSYSEVLDHSAREQLYRLIDRDGDLLLLRSDSTLFLARSVAPHIESPPEPIRLYYAEPILRHQHSEDPLHNEFYQIGAELMGRAGHRGEVEVAALLCALAQYIGIGNSVLHLGTRALFDALVIDLDPADRETAAAMIQRREWDSLRKLAGPGTEVFFFIGNIQEFEAERESIESRLPSDAAREAVLDLYAVAKTLINIDISIDLRIDFSEIGIQPYYTGCVLGLYLDGVPTAIAAGGRYDKLLEKFGQPYPSVGFSLMLSKITAQIDEYRPPETVVVAEHDVTQAMKQAAAIRARGGRATI